MRPGDAMEKVGSRAFVPELGIVGSLLVGRASPVVPACRIELGRKLGIDEDDTRVRTPGAAECGRAMGEGHGFSAGTIWIVGYSLFVGDGDPAVDDDVAGGLVGGCAGLRGKVADPVGVELGAVEDSSGVAEDEVDAAFDVGVDVVLAAVVGEEGVLMADEAAVLEDGAVGAHSDSDSLAGVAGGVLEGDVVGLEARAVDLDSFSKEGSASLFCIEAVGDDDVFGALTLADQCDVGVVRGDDDALVVCTGFDLYIDAAIFPRPGVMIERVLDGGEDGAVFIARVGVRGGGIDADVDVLCVENMGEESTREQ